MNKVITIIGGSGFIGTNLISELSNFEIFNLDKNNSALYNTITTYADIELIDTIVIPKNTNIVVLLAAEHKDNVTPISRYYNVNVEGTRNVLKKMDDLGINNLIFTSSVAVYGLGKNNPNELTIPEPFNHYGKSKLEAEQLIIDWYNVNPHNKSVTIIRPTVVFGENNRGNVYNLLNQMNSGKFLMIGNGKNIKSMSYVGNLVSFIKNNLILNEKSLQIFNYTDKPDITMIDLLKLINQRLNLKTSNIFIPYFIGLGFGYILDTYSLFFNKKVNISSIRIKKFCKTTQYNSDKAHSIFTPPYSIYEGLIRTLDHEFTGKKSNIEFLPE